MNRRAEEVRSIAAVRERESLIRVPQKRLAVRPHGQQTAIFVARVFDDALHLCPWSISCSRFVRCGEMVDKRQLDDVLFHGTDHNPRPDIQYGGSLGIE